MKLHLILTGLLLVVLVPQNSSGGPREGRGGFAGGSGRGSFGGGHGSFGGGEGMHHAPSFSGVSGGMSHSFNRPSGGGMVPHGGGPSASFGNRGSQQGFGGHFADRPNFDRPGGGGERFAGGGERFAGGGGERWPGGGASRPGQGGSGERWPGGGEGWAGGGQQANWPGRPGQGGAGERWPGGGQQGNWPGRPAQGGSGERWPGGGGERPNWPDRGQGGFADRNNFFGDRNNVFGNQTNAFGNRTNIGDRTNINTGNQGLNVNNINNNSINNIGNRSWNGQGYWHNNNWYGAHNYWNGHYANWRPGNWSGWYAQPAIWGGAGYAAGWLASGGDTYAYSNPFYVASPSVAYTTGPTDVSYNYVDYSQPIPQPPQQVVATYNDYGSGYDQGGPSDAAAPVGDGSMPPPGSAAPPAAADDEAPPEAFQRFDEARAAFKADDYSKALREVDRAIKLVPSDANMHEFRALALFAKRKYRDAAAGVYAVLSEGPGWTWDTLQSLYPDPDIYTRQLRALEDYCRKNPDASDGHFLLAYHYFVLNHVPQAVSQLKRFAELVPQDKLAPQLIAAFTPRPGSPSTERQLSEAPAKP